MFCLHSFEVQKKERTPRRNDALSCTDTNSFMGTNLELKIYDNEDQSQLLSTQKLTPKVEKWGFHYKKCTKNPAYQKGVKYLRTKTPPFDACLIGSNDNYLHPQLIAVKTQPKWLTTLGYYDANIETGEILGGGEYQTNEFKKSNGKKINSLDLFCNRYNDLYKKGKTSLMFHTFTRPNHARITFRRMLHLIRLRYKSIGYNVNGYLWTAEVSENLHWHYHLILALDSRLNIKGKTIPKELLFEDLWGQRTDVQFVQKNVRHYLAKYFAKHNSRVIGTRSYGRSRKFI